MSEPVIPNESDRAEIYKLLSFPLFFPDGFKTWVTDWFATNVPMIPYTQFLGARLNIAKSGDFVVGSESIASTSYGDLATIGPTIDGLVDGDYMIMFGAFCSGQGGAISRSINGAAADDDHSVQQNENAAALARAEIASLTNKNVNQIQLKYRNLGGGGPTFSHRWLVAFRISTG